MTESGYAKAGRTRLRRRSRMTRKQRQMDRAHTPLDELKQGQLALLAWKRIFKGIHTARSIRTIVRGAPGDELAKQRSSKRGGKTTNAQKRKERGWGPLQP